jgi:hypothetical protein
MSEITKELVEERLGLYKQESQRLFELFNIYKGAIQDCEYWLEVLNKEEGNKNG